MSVKRAQKQKYLKRCHIYRTTRPNTNLARINSAEVNLAPFEKKIILNILNFYDNLHVIKASCFNRKIKIYHSGSDETIIELT
jgi:hypothetical protein